MGVSEKQQHFHFGVEYPFKSASWTHLDFNPCSITFSTFCNVFLVWNRTLFGLCCLKLVAYTLAASTLQNDARKLALAKSPTTKTAFALKRVKISDLYIRPCSVCKWGCWFVSVVKEQASANFISISSLYIKPGHAHWRHQETLQGKWYGSFWENQFHCLSVQYFTLLLCILLPTSRKQKRFSRIFGHQQHSCFGKFGEHDKIRNSLSISLRNSIFNYRKNCMVGIDLIHSYIALCYWFGGKY